MRVEITTDDTLIGNYIMAARQWAEAYTGRAFVTQTWRLWCDEWPGRDEPWWDGMRDGSVNALHVSRFIELPKSPLQSVSLVQTHDDSDVATTWAATNYFVDAGSEPGRIVLRNGAIWPVPTRAANGIKIDFVAGYGAASAVPEAIKTAIRQIVSHWYENRGESGPEQSHDVPFVIRALLDPYRLTRIGMV
jgi:hypothetical protein